MTASLYKLLHITYRVSVAVVGGHGDDADAHGDARGVGDGGGQEHQARHHVPHAQQPTCRHTHINWFSMQLQRLGLSLLLLI